MQDFEKGPQNMLRWGFIVYQVAFYIKIAGQPSLVDIRNRLYF